MRTFAGKPEDMGERYASIAEASRMHNLPEVDNGATYTRDGTSSSTANAYIYFPSLFGISCQLYDIVSDGIDGLVTILNNQICAYHKPVLLQIKNNTMDVAHSIVVDGYKHTKTTITEYYAYYITDLWGRILEGQEPDSYGSQETTTEEKFVAINWGENGLFDSDITTGDTIWYNVYNNWLILNYNYNIKHFAVYGFHH